MLVKAVKERKEKMYRELFDFNSNGKSYGELIKISRAE